MKVQFHQVTLNCLSGYDCVKNVEKNRSKAIELAKLFNLPIEECYEDLTTRSPNDYVSWSVCSTTKVVLSSDELITLVQSGVNYKYDRAIEVDINPAELFAKTSEKNEVQLSGPSTNTYNNKCEVHMPGMALSTYNEVQLLEDVCTDILQQSLTAGWRIIAACPQPDARRPDYILGRFNPNKTNGFESASRGN
ncbi:hypothetical protein [Dickeya phage Amaethon]|nr:hypothetical protein [Dickeya phage Amaethon]